MRAGRYVLQGQLCWRKKNALVTIVTLNKLDVFKKSLGKPEWKMLLQASISKWNGIGLSEISIWCDILKWEVSCQQVGLFHFHQTHFVLTFLCSKFLEFFIPQTSFSHSDSAEVCNRSTLPTGCQFHFLCTFRTNSAGEQKNALQTDCWIATLNTQAGIEKDLFLWSFSVFLG